MHGTRACRFCMVEVLRLASSFMWLMLLTERRAGACARLGSFRGLGKTSHVWLVG